MDITTYAPEFSSKNGRLKIYQIKKYGFSLLESLLILSLILSFFAILLPNFQPVTEKIKLKQLVGEFTNLLTQVKAQAVYNQQSLLLEFSVINLSLNQPPWRVSLDPNFQGNLAEPISLIPFESSVVNWSDFRQILFDFPRYSITFSPLNGKPNRAFSFRFYLDPNKVIRIIVHNVTGRIRVCSEKGSYYGYARC